MKRIKTFDIFVNESVRDLMKPKSEEDIKQSLETTMKSFKNMNDDEIGVKIYNLLCDSFNDDVDKFRRFIEKNFGEFYSLHKSYINYINYDYGMTLARVIDKMNREQLLKFYRLIIEEEIYKTDSTNESVRDLMKPKSEEEIEKVSGDAIERISYEVSYYLVHKYNKFDDISEAEFFVFDNIDELIDLAMEGKNSEYISSVIKDTY